MSARQHIGEVIREKRLAHGYSLGQLATRVGKTAAVVRAWERGEDMPETDTHEALFATLEIDLDEVRDLIAPPPVEEPAVEELVEEPAEEPTVAEAEEPEPTGAAAAVFSDAAATAASVAVDHEAVDPVVATPSDDEAPPGAEAEAAAETEPGDADPTAVTDASEELDEAQTERETEVSGRDTLERPALDETGSPAFLADEPTEAIPAPVATLAPPLVEPSGYDIIEPVVAETPSSPPLTVPPLRLPNPIRLLFDPHRRFIYWIRYALTIVVLFVLLRLFFWAAGELWTALGDLLDTFRATDGEETEAIRFLLGF